MRVFLGGTCNGSTWRDNLIPLLRIDHFNPVVKEWNAEAQEKEKAARASCDYVLYVITPRMTGVYAIAEAVDDSNKRPDKTILCVLNHDQDRPDDSSQTMARSEAQIKSLEAVKDLVSANGGHVGESLAAVAAFLNGAEEALSARAD